MLEFAVQHVGDDFHVLVPVGREAATRLDAILIDDP